MINLSRLNVAIKTVQKKVDTLPVEKAQEFQKSLDMSFSEYCRFQELKSVGSMDGTLSLEAAQKVYAYLGNTVEHFNAQPVAVKYVLTELFAKLLANRMAA